MISILLYKDGGVVGRSDDVSIEMKQEPREMIDVSSLDLTGGFREFIPGRSSSSLTIVAKNMDWREISPLLDTTFQCTVYEDNRRIINMEVIIEEMSIDALSGTTARFKGVGAINYLGGTIDFVREPFPMTGLLEGKRTELPKRGFKIIKSRLHKDDTTGHTEPIKPLEGIQVDWIIIDDPMAIPTKPIKRGFKIIP